jgi:hypothetical protein
VRVNSLLNVEVKIFGQPGQAIQSVQACPAGEEERTVLGVVVDELENIILKNLFQLCA